MTAPAVFQARGLTKTYRMGDVEVQALRSVDLDLFRSELVVILGPSGSGKSTLLNILGGLDAPTSGQVRFLDTGDVVIPHPSDRLAEGVRVVQHP